MSIQVREVVLELLRHGHAHNQLLSPLTRYLALCGSHPAVTLTVPFEHRDLQHLLTRMRYGKQSGSAYAREQLSGIVTELLEQIPALPHEARVGDDEILHLRLMITPQELAMLPFELADPPSGFQTGGQPLLIGPTPDVVLTREVRRSGGVKVEVPERPRVLLVAASPPDYPLIPLAHHRAALIDALRPWVRPQIRDDRLTPDWGARLRVLEKASLDEIRRECASGRFTHVHILAHGDRLRKPETEGYGLALWDRDKERAEIVSGRHLALALRPPREDNAWASPWCVVLCTCDGSNVGGVVHPIASLAHALHVAGIPWVLASQYPLTYGAANALASTFYPLELGGEDPRRTLRGTRHAIASRMRRTHDWASLVAYARWPSDLERQLRAIRVIRVFRQLEAAQDWADQAINLADTREQRAGKGKRAKEPAVDLILRRSLELVEAAAARLRREKREQERQRRDIDHQKEINQISKHEQQHRLGEVTSLLTEIYGLLGSASKRRARLLEHLEKKTAADQAMRESAEWYRHGAALQAPEHWTPCQSFVMTALGHGPRRRAWASEHQYKQARDHWRTAHDIAMRSLGEKSGRLWALSTMIEVELWRDALGVPHGKSEQAMNPEDYFLTLLAEAGPERFEVKSTLRQLRRYREWWQKAGYVDARLIEPVEAVLEGPGKLVAMDDQVYEKLEVDLDSLESLTETADDALPRRKRGDIERVVLGGRRETGDRFCVQMLPARQGDALWVEYGPEGGERRLLIDGGFRTTIRTVEERIRELAAAGGGKCRFELGVVTHVDADHIEGMLEMMAAGLPVEFGDFWFNGRRHLDVPEVELEPDDDETLGAKHGLFLDLVMETRRLKWNRAFDGDAVVVPRRARKLPSVELAGGMKLTLLSPTYEQLDALARHWDSELRRQDLDGKNLKEVLEKLHYRTEAIKEEIVLGRGERPSGPVDVDQLLRVPDGADDAPANGSSIAFLAEYNDRSCLFMADAHPDVIIVAIDRLAGKDKRLPVGAVKLAHHGSGNNVTLDLLKRLDTRVFLISTNGGGHYHPDRHVIAKLIAGDWRPINKSNKIRILFNYRSEFTEIWDDKKLKERYHYETDYAEPGNILELSSVPKAPARRTAAKRRTSKTPRQRGAPSAARSARKKTGGRRR